MYAAFPESDHDYVTENNSKKRLESIIIMGYSYSPFVYVTENNSKKRLERAFLIVFLKTLIFGNRE